MHNSKNLALWKDSQHVFPRLLKHCEALERLCAAFDYRRKPAYELQLPEKVWPSKALFFKGFQGAQAPIRP